MFWFAFDGCCLFVVLCVGDSGIGFVISRFVVMLGFALQFSFRFGSCVCCL